MNVDETILKQVKGWAPYVDATLGFRNHWYPALMSSEVEEGQPQKAKMLGENIIVNRIDGKVYAMRDRCAHRGVPFSRRLECFKKGTITCWYHGWTFDWGTGDVVGIITNPTSSQIGRQKVRVFPAEEAKGLIFVYIGDGDPHPLSHDVPPSFLDENAYVLSRKTMVNSNWRLGCENGFDKGHVWIHKASELILGGDIALPVGYTMPPGGGYIEMVTEEDGPKGLFDDANDSTPVFEGIIGDEKVFDAHIGSNRIADRISMWLPATLCVDPFPQPDLKQFEFYVPVDERRHNYIQSLWKVCETDEERAAFEKDFHGRLVDLALIGFNGDDIWAREAGEDFYGGDGRGWVEEKLYEPDLVILEWRKLASKYNRGVQTPDHVWS